MRTQYKVLIAALCAVLLVVASVLGTVAYLTSDDKVENVFTVGKVALTLDESDVDEDGVVDGQDRVKANEYKLMPGHSYIKDPVVHVAQDSEACYLFVKVENGIAAIEDQANNIAAQMAANGWTLVEGETDVYAYSSTVGAGDYPVFESFAVAKSVDGDTLVDYADAAINVTAYAIQADGFTTAADAWVALNA